MHRLRQLTEHVWVAQSALYSTMSGVVVGDEGDAFVIDPGVYPGEIDALADDVAALGVEVVGGFATHAHWDHLLWSDRWPAVSRVATAGTAAALDVRRTAIVDEPLAAMGRIWPRQWDVAVAGAVVAADPGPVSVLHGISAEVLDVPGHVVGHGALFVDVDGGVLFAGDMVSDVEVPLPDWDQPDPLGSYGAGLLVLASLAARTAVIVPGHGNPGRDLAERVAADIIYVDAIGAGDVAGAAAADVRRELHPFNRDHHDHNVAAVAELRATGRAAR